MTQRENERLESIRDKMTQLKAQQQTILARRKERMRKDRTHRLIQKGALAEKYFCCADASPHDFEKVLQTIVKIDEVREVIREKESTESQPFNPLVRSR